MFSYDIETGLQLDYARFYLADTDAETAVLSNEEINAQLNKHGWHLGLQNLVNGLLSEFSREPVKYQEGNGAMIDLSARISVWENLLRRISTLPDPEATTPDTSSLSQRNTVTTRVNVNW